MGTPLYMSPEQAQGKPLDHRSDLYSLGVTFFHMIAGEPPFRATSAIAMAMKHVNETPPSISVFRHDVPPELDKLVLKLMAKSKAERYQSAGEMLRDLAKVRESMSGPTGIMTVTDIPTIPAPEVADGKAVEDEGPRAFRLAPEPLPARRKRRLADPETGGRQPDGGRRADSGGCGRLARAVLTTCSPIRPRRPGTMPGLWIAPAWKEIDKLNSPEEQYHFAQIRAPKEAQEAAWLAVPGHFPSSREWASRSFTQLARVLLRGHDAEKLAVFAEEVEHWQGAQAHERELAGIARAGVCALGGKVDGVLEEFASQGGSEITDRPGPGGTEPGGRRRGRARDREVRLARPATPGRPSGSSRPSYVSKTY